MTRLFISILTLSILTSCSTDKDSFCEKYDSDRNQIIESVLDSLKKADHLIIKNYFLLGQLDNETSMFEKNLLSNFRYNYSRPKDPNCNAMLRALSTIDTKKYLKSTDEGSIKSYIPIFTFDKFGKVKIVSAEIKYENGKIDTVTDKSVADFHSLVDKIEFRKSKKHRDDKLKAQRIEREQKQKEEERIQKLENEAKQKEEQERSKREIQELLDNSISARKLCKQYRENQIRADNAYLSKEILVKGIVSSVHRSFGEISINLEGDDFIATVSCVTTDSDGASRLQKGQVVVVKGICLGIDDITKTLVTIGDSKIVAH